jgi:hypothetical protein
MEEVTGSRRHTIGGERTMSSIETVIGWEDDEWGTDGRIGLTCGLGRQVSG